MILRAIYSGLYNCPAFSCGVQRALNTFSVEEASQVFRIYQRLVKEFPSDFTSGRSYFEGEWDEIELVGQEWVELIWYSLFREDEYILSDSAT